MTVPCKGGDGLCEGEAEADGFCERHHPGPYDQHAADFTPGPYAVLIEPKRRTVSVTASTGERIAERIVRMPDAHLFTAAPDLYSALAALVIVLDGGVPPVLTLVDARAALAKARGES